MKSPNNIRKHMWIVILPIAFLIYSNSFNNFGILEQKYDVLADADSAAFIMLIKDFHLAKKYGDEYNTNNRGLGDVAEKHKTHHILYVMVASHIYSGFSFLYHLLGIPQHNALYSINALLACFNILLLYVLLRYFNPDNEHTGLYILLYAFSLSTWIYASIPESWPFSATLILLFLVLFYKEKFSPVILSFLIGIFMLNNVFLGSLLIFIAVRHLLASENAKEFIWKTLLSSFTALTTWLGSLTVLSLYDASLRPDNLIRYTLWFRTFAGSKLPVYSLYAWKVIISNVFVNSILSNQSSPGVPLEALLYTLKGSFLGVISTLIYSIFLLLIFMRMVKTAKGDCGTKKKLKSIFMREDLHPAMYCIIWLLLTVNMQPTAAFLYSTVMVPLLIVLMQQFINSELRHQKVLLGVVIFLVIINNTAQILKFRAALSVMS
jgi:hypothetical protein